MLGEATLDVSGTFAGEAIRLPIQIAALQSSIASPPPHRLPHPRNNLPQVSPAASRNSAARTLHNPHQRVWPKFSPTLARSRKNCPAGHGNSSSQQSSQARYVASATRIACRREIDGTARGAKSLSSSLAALGDLRHGNNADSISHSSSRSGSECVAPVHRLNGLCTSIRIDQSS
jgi:hypothetical protein